MIITFLNLIYYLDVSGLKLVIAQFRVSEARLQ